MCEASTLTCCAAVAHQLEVLRYGGLCCPRRSSLLLPPPTSARHSTISRATLIGFAVTGAPDDGTRRARVAGVETDLSCSTMGCVIVPLPLRRRVSGAARPRSLHRPWPSPVSAGLGTRLSPAVRVGHDAVTGFLAYGPITCSPPTATLSWRFDSRISPSAGHQLRGRLAATPAGLSPASPSQVPGHTTYTHRPAILAFHPRTSDRLARVNKVVLCRSPTGAVLHPEDRDVGDLDAPLCQQLFNIRIRQRITQVSPDRHHDPAGIEIRRSPI